MRNNKFTKDKRVLEILAFFEIRNPAELFETEFDKCIIMKV